jgi:hypothetical protein
MMRAIRILTGSELNIDRATLRIQNAVFAVCDTDEKKRDFAYSPFDFLYFKAGPGISGIPGNDCVKKPSQFVD